MMPPAAAAFDSQQSTPVGIIVGVGMFNTIDTTLTTAQSIQNALFVKNGAFGPARTRPLRLGNAQATQPQLFALHGPEMPVIPPLTNARVARNLQVVANVAVVSALPVLREKARAATRETAHVKRPGCSLWGAPWSGGVCLDPGPQPPRSPDEFQREPVR